MSEKDRKYTTEQVADAFTRNGGNISATSRELKIHRSTVQEAVRKAGLNKKPLVAGDKIGIVEQQANLPAKGLIKRYILTSAQNNTHVNKPFWSALLTLAEHYEAEILVGTFSYNQNNFGQLAVKQGTKNPHEKTLWFDPLIADYISDKRIALAHGLVWCGEMNILPTAVNPLEGLETYSHRKSAIFPHVKVAMRSIATMQGEGTKLNYTTGTVTLRNYIQKKEGLKAEHHHRYAALVVEVDHTGYWCVRQVGWSNKSDVLQDLDVVVKDGKVTTGNRVEAITWGDLHATHAEPWVIEQSIAMLDLLRPQYQFLHDIMEGVSTNRHQVKDRCPHYAFHRWLRGFHRVEVELAETRKVLERYLRPWCRTVVPDSNHDGWWLKSWLAKFDYRVDPGNAELFLRLQSFMYSEIRKGKGLKDVNITERAFVTEAGLEPGAVRFLLPDESFIICNRKIECGMHGHLGPNGAQGSPVALSKVGRRANIAHTHTAGIYDGLYVAGTTSKLKWDYAYGPSSWTHAHIITYPNGMRAIVSMWAGKWRAE